MAQHSSSSPGKKPVSPYSDYDRLAWVYNIHWGPRYAQQVLPVIDKLVLESIPAEARILDLCCGTGQLTDALLRRGYAVTGIDGSEEMLRLARENAPAAEFIVEDARSFNLPSTHDAVVSVFDSLNHVIALDELTSVFRNVRMALREEGVFLFDLNMEEGYKARWRGSYNIVEDDHVCLVRLGYHPDKKMGESQLTIFRLNGQWERSDLTLFQKCYTEDEIRSALATAGLGDVAIYDGSRDLQLNGKGTGRSFFVCRNVARGSR
jgi:SAM-dependent methyltransferase